MPHVWSLFHRLCCSTSLRCVLFFFFFNDTAPTEIYTLSLHDALPICAWRAVPLGVSIHLLARHMRRIWLVGLIGQEIAKASRSEEHTSELQSPCNLVCRLLLEKKKIDDIPFYTRSTHYHLSAYYRVHC